MMTNTTHTVEFTPASPDTPWQLENPLPTDIRAVVNTTDQPTVESVGDALATYIGEAIEAEEIETQDSDMLWAMRIRLVGLPTDMVVWAEKLNDASREASGIQDGWIIAMQTVLHSSDPLIHFSNIMRLFSGADLGVESVCDLATGRWFPRQILDKLFVHDTTQPPEEVLWITRVVEAPEGGDPEEMWAWITTHGLARCGRVELEMLGVPAILTSEAAHVVDGLAALTLETPLPPVGQAMSLGPGILVSLLECGTAVNMLQKEMPGSESRSVPSVAITSPDGVSVFPEEALEALRTGDTAVSKTSRFTKRQATLARSEWKMLLDAAEQIGESDHAACMVQVPWTNTEDDDSLSEYLWFRITKVETPNIIGTLAHEPKYATSLPEGHEEKLSVDDVTDWVVMTPVGPMGPSDSEAIAEFLSQFTK
ncbi:MAG: DUF2314 domain-containing protein [Phycisphaerae bacterium]|jgi:uncharacterized protein YegJ (DUF2314 family)|nr:DUF2314 domain-containing protein [Phycisphaerae bacterium]